MRVVTWENEGGKGQVLYCILSHFTAILLNYFMKLTILYQKDKLTNNFDSID